MSDYVICIGGAHYDESTFRSEAQTMGVSRRLNGLPVDFKVGESRIYCAFGATKEVSHQKKCTTCGFKPLPKVEEKGKCPDCGAGYKPRYHASKGVIPCYFVPDAVEVVFRLTDSEVKTMAQGMAGLGVINAEFSNEIMRVDLKSTNDNFENMKGAVEMLADMAGCDAVNSTAIANVIMQPGAKIVTASRELKRGCGYRSSGGVYIVRGGKTPLVDIKPPIVSHLPHFRGVRKLEDDEASRCRLHCDGKTETTLGDSPLMATVRWLLEQEKK